MLIKRILQIFALCTVSIASASTLILPSLDVTATKSEPKSTKVANHYAFSQKQIQQQGATSLPDFLKKQGILKLQSRSANRNQTSISIHGFGDNANLNSLILIDGIPYTTASTIGPNLNSLLIQNIQNITIIPGSNGVLYGDQAVGGVVEIDTRIPGKKYAAALMQYGDYDELMNAFFSKRFDNHVGFSLGAEGEHKNSNLPNDESNNYTINAKLDYVGDRGNISLNFLGLNQTTEIPNPQIYGQRTATTVSNNYADDQNGFSYLIANYYFSPNFHWHTALANNSDFTKGIIRFPFNREQSVWFLQNQVSLFHYFKLGDDVNYENYNVTSSVLYNRASALDNAFYALVALPFNIFEVDVGGRFASHTISAWPSQFLNEKNYDQLAISTADFIWHINNKIQFYVRRAGNYRFPKADEIVWTNNNLLKSQTGASYESGIDWHDGRHEFKLAVYQLYLQNELAFDPAITPTTPFGKLTNLPPTERRGIDAFFSAPLNDYFSLNLQASAVDAYFSSGRYENKQIPAVSPYRASATLEYANENGWVFMINEVYNSQCYAADDLANISQKIPAYFITNLYLAKTWRNITFGISVDNLFDQSYARYAYFEPNDNQGVVNYFPGAGLSIIGTINFQIDD